jgi:hypothetical protein
MKKGVFILLLLVILVSLFSISAFAVNTCWELNGDKSSNAKDYGCYNSNTCDNGYFSFVKGPTCPQGYVCDADAQGNYAGCFTPTCNSADECQSIAVGASCTSNLYPGGRSGNRCAYDGVCNSDSQCPTGFNCYGGSCRANYFTSCANNDICSSNICALSSSYDGTFYKNKCLCENSQDCADKDRSYFGTSPNERPFCNSGNLCTSTLRCTTDSECGFNINSKSHYCVGKEGAFGYLNCVTNEKATCDFTTDCLTKFGLDYSCVSQVCRPKVGIGGNCFGSDSLCFSNRCDNATQKCVAANVSVSPVNTTTINTTNTTTTPSCTTDASCGNSTQYCLNSVCTNKKVNGQACTGSSQCTSGYCDTTCKVAPKTCEDSNDCEDGEACFLQNGRNPVCKVCTDNSRDEDGDGDKDCTEDLCVGSRSDQCRNTNTGRNSAGVSCSSLKGVTCSTGTCDSTTSKPSEFTREANCCVPKSSGLQAKCTTSQYSSALSKSVAFERKCLPSGLAEITVVDPAITGGNNKIALSDFSKLGLSATSNPYTEEDFTCGNIDLLAGEGEPVYGYGILAFLLSIVILAGFYGFFRNRKLLKL